MKEEWKPIKGYEGLYQVSNLGRVKALKVWKVGSGWHDQERIMSPVSHGNGYLYVTLFNDKHRKNHYIHRLGAEAFCIKPHGKDVVNHKNYDRGDNRADNLEWVTQKENTNYSKHRMRHPRDVHYSNTGERYISRRPKTGMFRVTIKKKEYGPFATIEEAIAKRNQIMKEVGIV